MSSTATFLAAENRVVGHTVLSNDCQLAGFHGAVVAVLGNASGQAVAYGELRRFGIDGKGPCYPHVISWWPFRSEWRCPRAVVRHVYWEDAIDPGKAQSATTLTLVQAAAPNSWLESLQSLRRHLDEAIAIGKQVGEVVTIIKGA
jgi:hypothetical protein